MNFTPAPIQSGWGSDSKNGPQPVWALWFKNLHTPNDTYVTQTNITHGGTLTKSVSITKVGRVVTAILTLSDSVSTSSTVGTTKFSLPYIPTTITPVIAINATTHATLGNGYVSTDGNLYSPTFTTTAGQSVVMTVTYFTT
jgi:hypothetical protein